MGRNSQKPVETGNSQVCSLEVVQQWLRREGGVGKAATGITALVEMARDAVAKGELPPEKDGATLVDIWRMEHPDPGETATQLRASDYKRWWSAREQQVRQLCQDAGCAWLPQLEVRPGGGRGNPTLYSISLEPLTAEQAEDSTSDEPQGEDGAVRYRIDPAKPALWLRILLGSRPFPVASWRGYVLLGSAAINFMLIGLIWWAVLVEWMKGRPITTADLSLGALAFAVSWALWRLTRPMRLLPTNRVVLAHEAFLSVGTLHGQLRTMRDGRSRVSARKFSVVRHWAVCPVCAAEIDLSDGGAEFPRRLVGRCNDAPTEHIYSFDPVRLTGMPLREGLVGATGSRSGDQT